MCNSAAPSTDSAQPAMCTATHSYNNNNTNNNNNIITYLALKSSGPSSEAQQNKIIDHIQVPGTCRGHHQFKGPPTIIRWENNFEEISFEIVTERGKTFTRFKCGWEFIPNDGCSNRECTLAQVQCSYENRKLL